MLRPAHKETSYAIAAAVFPLSLAPFQLVTEYSDRVGTALGTAPPSEVLRHFNGHQTQMAGTLLCTHKTVTKGRSTFSRSTEHGPACLSTIVSRATAFTGEVPALLSRLTKAGIPGNLSAGYDGGGPVQPRCDADVPPGRDHCLVEERSIARGHARAASALLPDHRRSQLDKGGGTRVPVESRCCDRCERGCRRDDSGKAGPFSVELLKMDLPFVHASCAQTSTQRSAGPLGGESLL